MNVLAIIYLTLMMFALLPGSAFKVRSEIDWGSPHAYTAISSVVVGVALAIWVLIV